MPVTRKHTTRATSLNLADLPALSGCFGRITRYTETAPISSDIGSLRATYSHPDTNAKRRPAGQPLRDVKADRKYHHRDAGSASQSRARRHTIEHHRAIQVVTVAINRRAIPTRTTIRPHGSFPSSGRSAQSRWIEFLRLGGPVKAEAGGPSRHLPAVYCPLAAVGVCAGAASERARVAQLVPTAEIH